MRTLHSIANHERSRMRHMQHFYLFFPGIRGQHGAYHGTQRTGVESMHVDEPNESVRSLPRPWLTRRAFSNRINTEAVFQHIQYGNH